jgi:hypothetical protein
MGFFIYIFYFLSTIKAIMSVTIKSRNKDVKFYPNTAGWQLYGFVNAVCNVLIYFEDFEMGCPRPPDSMTVTQAKSAGKQIAFKLLESDMAVYRLQLLESKAKGLYSGDLKEIIKSYSDWLIACGGYRLI